VHAKLDTQMMVAQKIVSQLSATLAARHALILQKMGALLVMLTTKEASQEILANAIKVTSKTDPMQNVAVVIYAYPRLQIFMSSMRNYSRLLYQL
jgi:hypothetical protein